MKCKGHRSSSLSRGGEGVRGGGGGGGAGKIEVEPVQCGARLFWSC